MQKEPMSSDDAGPSAGAAPEAADSALPQDSAGKQAVSVLWSFGKCLCALLPAYLAGYFGFGISVVVLGLLVYIGWKHSRDGKQARLQSAMYYSLENKQDVTTARVFRSKRELPAWVNFPDVEKVEWMNQILQQAWPFIGQYLEKLLVETIAPSIRATSTYLQTLSFTKVNLGDKAMRVVGVKAYTENDKRQVILDLYISYAGDLEINVEVKRYFSKAGVKGIQLHGRLRVILEPLIGDVPLIGAITMFFIRRPKLDINWTGLTNLLDIPCLNNLSDTMIMDAIASFLVLPNRLTVPLVANLQVAQLRSPLPRGIVRIHLLEAENLTAKDYLISGKSDPYAVLRVGTQTFTSHYVDNNLNPQWKEMYEVIVHEVPGQELELEVFDKDPDKDDFLGRNKKIITVYGKTANPPSAAILTVYLDRAQDLPFKKGNKDPSPMVQISVQETTKESRTVYGTNNPVWEDAFTFFIQDPRKQDIDIQVKDEDKALTLGGLSIPLSSLLSSAELSMDQWFQLEKSGPASQGDNESEVSPGLTPTSKLPEHTSPDGNFASEGVLRIHLVEAQSLVAKDSLMGGLVEGKSDPFVKIRVGGLAFKSQVIKENLNPIWNELYEVCMLIDFMCNVASFLKEKDFISSCVNLCQKDHIYIMFSALECILYESGALGSLVLPVRELLDQKDLVLDRWFSLDEAMPESQILLRAELKVRNHTHIQHVLSSRMHLHSARMKYIIQTALAIYLFFHNSVFLHRNLPSYSKDPPDTYISFILLPDKNRNTKRKTSVKKKSLKPEFNERFDFDMSLEEAKQKQLEVSVKNSVSFMSREKELLGKVFIM
uniref:Extended synaptotagmin-like protein 1a n=1 Tax=Cyprinus carpio TaxID=7962 RepID=A0A8C1Z855_CYPCA